MRSTTVALLGAALSAAFATYVAFSLLGQLHVGRLTSLAGVGLLALGAGLGTWLATRNGERRGRAAVTVLAYLLVITIAVDGLLFFRILRLEPAHDFGVIPFRDPIATVDGYRTYVQSKRWSAENVSAGQAASLIPDTGFHEPHRMRVMTDELGFRNALGAPTRRQDVVILGDSFVFGYGLDQDPLWTERLGQLLNNRAVYNLGLYGASPSHSVELLRELVGRGSLQLSARPVLILHVFEGNDFTDPSVYEYQFTGPQIVREFRVASAQWLDYGLIAQVVIRGRRLLSQAKSRGTPYQVATSPRLGQMAFHTPYMAAVRSADTSAESADAVFKSSSVPKALQRLKDEAQRLSARVIVMYQPTKYRTYARHFPDLTPPPPELHLSALLRQASLANGFEYLDLTPIFQARADSGEVLFWRDDTHLNDAGHMLLAELTRGLLE